MNRSIQIFAFGLLVVLLAGCNPAAATQPTAAAAPTAPASATTSASARPTRNPVERVNGTIQGFAGGKLTLSDGKSFSVTDKTRIIRIESAKPSDLQSGDYVAVTAKRQPDNTLLASMVNVFPASMKGVGVGQRPMNGGNLMTNATIDKVSGDSFTVTFPGGGAQVKLTPDAQVSKLIDGSQSDLKEGATASAVVSQGVAQSISVH